jgi:hypothetical protein
MRLLFALTLLAGPTLAQDRMPSHCIALAAAEPKVVPVALEEGLEADSVLIRYIDHASFAIVTPDGTMAVTDYTGYLGAQDIVPDVVTMNNAHSTHWTAAPDSRIPNVLRGWSDTTAPADHRLDLGAMLVRNVTTDTRGPFGWELDLHFRSSRSVHRSSGASPPDPVRGTICCNRQAGRGHGPGRRRLHHAA